MIGEQDRRNKVYILNQNTKLRKKEQNYKEQQNFNLLLPTYLVKIQKSEFFTCALGI